MLKMLRRIRIINYWTLLTALLLYSWILIHYISVVTTFHRPEDTSLVEILFYITTICFITIMVRNIHLLPKDSRTQERVESAFKKRDFRIPVLIILTGVFVFYGIKYFGLLPSALLFSFISYPLIGEKRIFYILSATFILLAIVFCLFQFWLRSPLPWGIFYDFVRPYGVY